MVSPLRELLAKYDVVLGSSSLQRRMILDQLQLKFRIVPSTFDEEAFDKRSYEDGEALVKTLAEEKAKSVAETLNSSQKSHLVIGADTVIIKDNTILGKPHTPDVAVRTLRLLSGQKHSVCTGVAVILVEPNREHHPTVFCERTEVQFGELSQAQIQSYVDTGEPLNKAGAYGIQGLGAALVESIAGDYNNVVGFPAYRFCREMTDLLSMREQK